MKCKRLFGLLIACVFVLGCLATPAGAVSSQQLSAQAITRATDKINASIPANSILPLGDSVSLDINETITYNFTYTPRTANVDFGFFAPDGLFYSLSGSNGSINKTIRVSQRGSYTLAIYNSSDSTVTVTGTVNY